MFRKLFTKPEISASAPPGRRIYAVGDVHGCAAELDALMDLIAADADGVADARIVFLGDYVDRGPDTPGVLDRLIAIGAAHPQTVFLKGNHEAALLDFLHAPEDMRHWLDWGGEETLRNYGVDGSPSRPGEEIAAELVEAMPDDHFAFLTALDLKHIEGDYLFVHAGVRPGVALEDQDEQDLLWIRKRFHNAAPHERPAYTVVHGHERTQKALDAGWRIGVDTGACWTGRLTAVVIEDRTRRFITATA